MADLQSNKKNGRLSATNPRIDLTPLVDLGFLLLTFFIWTSSMNKQHKAMDIQMPYTPSSSTTAYYASSAITFIPAEHHRIFYYEGLYQSGTLLKEVNSLGEHLLRNILLEKQKRVSQSTNKKEREVQVLIKAHTTATLDDIIRLFDEVNILKIQYVAMVDLTKEESLQVDGQLGTVIPEPTTP